DRQPSIHPERHQSVANALLVDRDDDLLLEGGERADPLHPNRVPAAGGLVGDARGRGSADDEQDDHDEQGARHGTSIGLCERRLESQTGGGSGGSAASGAVGARARRCWCQSIRSTWIAPATGIAPRAPRIPASLAPTSTATSTTSGESWTVRE